MNIRALNPGDLRFLADIDATIESTEYLHVDRGTTADDALAIGMQLSIEPRPLRGGKQITSNPLDDDVTLAMKQLATGADEGIALVAEHDGQLVAVAIAQPDPARGTLRLLDVRVDYDFRRQGLGTAMVFQI